MSCTRLEHLSFPILTNPRFFSFLVDEELRERRGFDVWWADFIGCRWIPSAPLVAQERCRDCTPDELTAGLDASELGDDDAATGELVVFAALSTECAA